jgi:hypothetical protein
MRLGMIGGVGRVLAVAALLGASACGTAPDCGPLPGRPMLLATLYFGRAIADGGMVSDREWEDFLDAEVTPRFPDGFTVTDGRGQWRDTDSRAVVRESSKVLLVVTPSTPAALGKLDDIAAAYKRRFHQQAVGETLAQACAAF